MKTRGLSATEAAALMKPKWDATLTLSLEIDR